MGRRTKKRERQLGKIRDRQQRSGRAPDSAVAAMKFLCPTCGTRIERPGSIIIGDMQVVNETTGVVTKLSPPTWAMTCPVCGQTAHATNQVRMEGDGIEVSGFADTPEQASRLFESIEELRRLRADAGLEEVLEVLERRPDTRPVALWLREHYMEILATVGTAGTLVGIVIALLAWLAPQAPDQGGQPATPPGVTQSQLERLVSEVRDATRAADERELESQRQRDQNESKRRPAGRPEDHGPTAERDAGRRDH